MTKVTPTTKDQLIYYLLSNISLGTYDRRFLNNLQTVHVANKKPVTSNQSELLDKIVGRYKRQLAKQELSDADMVALPWTIAPITSLPQFTEAHISISEDLVTIHSPYKVEFVKEFREYKYSTWLREERCWTLPLCEETLKFTITTASKHYNKVNYCPLVQEVVDSVATFNAVKYWDPTLVKLNGNYYISAITPKLAAAVENIPLSTDLPTLARLVHYGISISDEIIQEVATNNVTVEKAKFAAARESSLEFNDELILDHLLSIETDYVLMSDWSSVNRSFSTKIQAALKSAEIPYSVIDRRKAGQDIDMSQYVMPVILSGWSFISNSPLAALAAKSINLVNSTPIDIK